MIVPDRVCPRLSSRGLIRGAYCNWSIVEILLQSGDNLIRDCNCNKMSARHELRLTARESLCHPPGHGGRDDDVVETLPQGDVIVLGQIRR